MVIDAENPLRRLLPGMTANVEIVTGEHKQVVVVPNEVLRFQPRGPAQAAIVQDGMSTGVSQLGDRGSRMLERLKAALEQICELNQQALRADVADSKLRRRNRD